MNDAITTNTSTHRIQVDAASTSREPERRDDADRERRVHGQTRGNGRRQERQVREDALRERSVRPSADMQDGTESEDRGQGHERK